MKPGEWRGCSCCSDGQVDLPAVEGGTRVDELWCGKEGEDAAKAKLLLAHPRKFNNALALAYEQVEEPEVESGGWQPSVVIQGKLYHKIGPLQPEEGAAPAFATTRSEHATRMSPCTFACELFPVASVTVCVVNQ